MNAISASSVASGASAMSVCPEEAISTVFAPGIFSWSSFTALGGVITSRRPTMKSAGHLTFAALSAPEP